MCKYDKIINKLKEDIKSALPTRRYKHTLNVRDMAVKMSKKYDVDAKKAEIAALSHDIVKDRPKEELSSLIDKYDLDPDLKSDKNLSHGKIAAEILRDNYGVDDDDILEAVAFHTTGKKDMSTLDMIIYLADATEPGRNYLGVGDIRRIAKKDLKAAVLESLRNTHGFLVSRDRNIDKNTTEAIEWLEGRIN